MDGTEGLVRGEPCVDTRSPIMIPVGPKTLGRIINVIGEPIDERGPINTEQWVKDLVSSLIKGGGGVSEILEGMLILVWVGPKIYKSSTQLFGGGDCCLYLNCTTSTIACETNVG